MTMKQHRPPLTLLTTTKTVAALLLLSPLSPLSPVSTQRLPYMAPNDDSRRVIPVTMSGADGSASSNHSAEVCATPPPPYGYRDRMTTLQEARRAEKRGLSRRDSGLEQLGLESLYDIVEWDHPLWARGEDLLEEDETEHGEGKVKRDVAKEEEEEEKQGWSGVWGGKTVAPAKGVFAAKGKREIEKKKKTAMKKEGGKRLVRRQATPDKIVVETYFHLVSTKDQSQYYTAKRRGQIFNNQAIALNQAYRESGISFHINPSTYTIRDEWATDAASTNMKKALRRGTYNALNIYFQTNLTSGGTGGNTLLGYCTLPTNVTYVYGGKTYVYPASNWATDGCNVLASSMPGSPVAVYGYNLGRTAVHEVGHWFGLLHTFQDNTCAAGSAGDYIDDTPQESTSTVGCPRGKDSCPTVYGLDPISNYMDYSDDQCYTNFSPQQQIRMRDLFTSLRAPY